MKKTKFTLLLIAVIMMIFQANIFAERHIKIVVGGERLKTDVAPIIVDGRTMLPVRAVFEAIGAKVKYDANTRKVTATKKDRTVEMVIDSNIMTVNGEKKTLDVPATIVNSRTLVPVRACTEVFDLDVKWIDKTRTVKIKKDVSLLSEWHQSVGNWTKYTYNNDGNLTYMEDGPYPFGIKSIYDENGNEIYCEYSDGRWYKSAYDEYDNRIYFENSDGLCVKSEFDDNDNEIYEERSNGIWSKHTYDANDNLIYSEYWHGNCFKYTYDDKGNLIYEEDSDGHWQKYTYDNDNNLIFSEATGDYWKKSAYDDNGNLTYEEDSNGDWRKYKYDDNNNLIYFETPDEYYTITTYYDENGNLIYEEYSDGDWRKYIVMVK